MVLYVVQVPDPAPGADWITVVPGQYLYDVTGVAGTLVTGIVGDRLADLSPNHNDGTFTAPTNFGAFVPGLLAGADAWQPNAAPGTPHFDAANLPNIVSGWTAPFTLAWWQRIDVSEIGGGIAWFLTVANSGNGGFQLVGQASASGPGNQTLTVFSGGGIWAAPGTVLNADGVAHHVALVYDGGTGFDLYVDGAFVAWAVAIPDFPPDPTDLTQFGNPDIGAGAYQAFGAFPAALTAGNIAALAAAGAGGIVAYTAAALGFNPTAFYLLDGVASGTGRTPALEVTDGTSTVVRIGDGFPAVSGPGPFEYAWQPGLPADSQTANGTVTTIGIPKLVLPAGYTIGTRTPDLQPGDQWHDVTIWWDDAYQNAVNPRSAYNFGNGAHLQYRQIGATP